MPGEVEAAKAAAEAATTIVKTEPILGSLLVFALVAILGLFWWVRSIHHSWGQERERWQQQLLDVQEKRISEGRTALSALSDQQALLSQMTGTLRDMERSGESIGLLLRDFSAEERAASASHKESTNRIEAILGRLVSRIEQPLVETPQGLRRPPREMA